MRLTLVAPVLVLAAVACAPKKAAGPKEIAGDCKPIYGASICTWAEMADSQVVAVGATIPLATIDSAPHEGEMVWPPKPALVLAIPAEARAKVGADHLSFFWEPHGHPPATMMTPHFDFHIYVIGQSDREAIDCKDTAKPTALPAGYVLPDVNIPQLGMLTGLCVPGMGMHAVPAQDTVGSAPFGGTMVYGYYAQRPIFYEPMISRAMLEERRSFTLPVPPQGDLPAGVHYPTKFEAVYDSTTPAYRFVFSGFSQ
jgi:hypothetical protein